MITEIEARYALSLNEPELLSELGSDITGPQWLPMTPSELAEQGERWLKGQTELLQEHICASSMLRSFATHKPNDKVAICVELANLLVGLSLPVNPVPLAALLTQKGLELFCKSQWKTPDAG